MWQRDAAVVPGELPMIASSLGDWPLAVAIVSDRTPEPTTGCVIRESDVAALDALKAERGKHAYVQIGRLSDGATVVRNLEPWLASLGRYAVVIDIRDWSYAQISALQMRHEVIMLDLRCNRFIHLESSTPDVIEAFIASHWVDGRALMLHGATAGAV